MAFVHYYSCIFILNFIDLLNHPSVFFFYERIFFFFLSRKIRINSQHLTVFITFKLIESRSMPNIQCQNKTFNSYEMRCSTRDEIIYNQKIKKKDIKTGLLYVILFLLPSEFMPCLQTGGQKERQKPHLSYNINKICIYLLMRFENSTKKKSNFDFFFLFVKSSLRSLPTITSFDYNVENNFWFIEILFYAYISDPISTGIISYFSRHCYNCIMR